MASKNLIDDLSYTLAHAQGPGRDYSVLLAMFKTFKPHFKRVGLILTITDDSEIDDLKLKIKARDTFLKRIGIDPQKVEIDGIDMGAYGYNDETQAN